MRDRLVDGREVEKLLVITGALEGGVVDALAAAEGPPPERAVVAREVAERAGTDERATRIILDALADLGLVEARDVRDAGPPAETEYLLTPLGRKRLVDPGPELERYSLLHQATKARGWLDLPYVLEHGRPQPRERTAGGLRSFVRTMAEGDPAVMEEVVDAVLAYSREAREAVGASGRPRVLDVGGAVGHMALRFVDRGAQATLCDRPEVLEQAREYQGKMAEQLRLEPCDFTEGIPEGAFDIVYLGNVYHIYGPDTNRVLTRRAFEHLSPGGVIAIRDFVLGRSPRAPLFAVNMLQATQEGGVWREDQYRAWLEEAGFVGVVVRDLELSSNQLVLGRRL